VAGLPPRHLPVAQADQRGGRGDHGDRGARAFDIIYVLNTPRRTEVLSILTTNNLLGEAAATSDAARPTATILFVLCFGFVIWSVTNHYRNTQKGDA
jgi:hypothetical protein